MAKTLVLEAQLRESTGSRKARALRKSGRIPAVVYGHGKEVLSIALDRHEFTERLHHSQRLLEVKLGRGKETLLVKDLQYDHMSRYVIHADLVRVDLSERVRVAVAIEIKGTAKGIHQGGIVDALLNHLEVECKASEIPGSIAVSVRDLDVGDTVRARDVVLPEGVKLVTDPNALLLHCHLVAIAKTTEELEQEAPVAPEVITERAVEEEKGEGEQQ